MNTDLQRIRQNFLWWPLLAGTISLGAMLPDAEVTTWKPNPARHTITIAMMATNATQKKMIRLAENTAPATVSATDSIAAPQPDSSISNWWSDIRNGIKVPYAITADAITYYKGVVRANRKKSWETYLEPSSSMSYMAAVAFHPAWSHDGAQFASVYVVTMELRFSADFTEDATTGITFTKKRSVVLDKNGTVKAVFGDGPTEAPMMAI